MTYHLNKSRFLKSKTARLIVIKLGFYIVLSCEKYWPTLNGQGWDAWCNLVENMTFCGVKGIECSAIEMSSAMQNWLKISNGQG